MFRNVISFTTIEWNLETSDSVADYSVCFEMAVFYCRGLIVM